MSIKSSGFYGNDAHRQCAQLSLISVSLTLAHQYQWSSEWCVDLAFCILEATTAPVIDATRGDPHKK